VIEAPSAERSRIMRSVKGKDTTPELVVRRWLHAHGYRFRLHRKDLPGRPDIVLPGRRALIFVHGCFWHGHDCPRGDRQPKANADYWRKKIDGNIARDRRHLDALAEMGWRTLIVWECETRLKAREAMAAKLDRFLEAKDGAAA
jgi:DNA mismatch endonuclease (patch repair protein)